MIEILSMKPVSKVPPKIYNFMAMRRNKTGTAGACESFDSQMISVGFQSFIRGCKWAL